MGKSGLTIANTVAETEIFRAAPDTPALQIQGRVFEIYTTGIYSTASSNDGFDYRIYSGPVGFDPTAGEGTLISAVSTVQANVTDGPWQSRTILVVNAVGETGSLANHTHAAFNNNPKDVDNPSTPIDTTTGKEFVTTVQWNNAKAGNSVTRGIAYLQQQA